MVQSESRKRATDKWHKDNLVKVGANIRKDLAEEFARVCSANGESMHSVIKRCIEEYIDTNRPMT